MGLLKLVASSNYISVNRTLIKLFGLEEAVVLGELCSEYDYWEKENKLLDGYMFFCTVAKMEENTGLSEYKQRQAIKSLEEVGVITTHLKGIPATRYFEINEDKLFNILRRSSEKIKELDTEKLSPSNTINNKNSNKDIFNNKLLNISETSETPVKKSKSKKLSMYEKCINMIEEFTDDEILKDMLKEFLKRCLENSREANTQFYSNHFKGKLNKLQEFTDDSYEQRKYVKQTLDNGWNGFYELRENKTQKYNRNTHERLQESGAAHVQSCREELMEDIKNGRAERF